MPTSTRYSKLPSHNTEQPKGVKTRKTINSCKKKSQGPRFSLSGRPLSTQGHPPASSQAWLSCPRRSQMPFHATIWACPSLAWAACPSNTPLPRTTLPLSIVEKVLQVLPWPGGGPGQNRTLLEKVIVPVRGWPNVPLPLASP